MKDIRAQIDDVRALLNDMVASKDIELTDVVVINLSRQLDELINLYIQELDTP